MYGIFTYMLLLLLLLVLFLLLLLLLLWWSQWLGVGVGTMLGVGTIYSLDLHIFDRYDSNA